MSSDFESLKELENIGKHMKSLAIGNKLPENKLIDLDGKLHSSNQIFNQKSIVFFWTNNHKQHMISAHKNALKSIEKHPDYQVVSINIDDEEGLWKESLDSIETGKIRCYKAKDFALLKDQWVVIKLQRTFILDENGKIAHPFVNIFDVDFDKKL